MKNIRYCYIHPTGKNNNLKNLIFDNNSNFNMIYDDKNPDYVIASEYIYLDKNFQKMFLSLQKTNVVNIYFARELISPDLNIFDYAICFDRNLSCDDRILRIPTVKAMSQNYISEIIHTNNRNAKELLKSKKSFCNFIYSNKNAHPNRDKLFYKLSEYKKVDSLGPHLHNTNIPSSRNLGNWFDISIEQKNNYKFSIAAENACYKGYTSEKIITSFLANTIPIYWGDPSIELDFNPKAFINANNKTFDEVLDLVKEIDNNDDLWCEYISQPIMTQEQVQKFYEESEMYKENIIKIFSQSLNDAKRCSYGYYPDIYFKLFSKLTTLNTLNKHLSIKDRFFSIKNEDNHKQINLLGCKFKIKTNH